MSGARLRDLRALPLLVRITALLVVYSLLVWWLAWALDLHHRPGEAPEAYRTYKQKANWFLYPVFFPVIALLINKAWRPFVRAWKDDPPGVSMLRIADGSPVPERIRRLFVAEIEASRPLLVGLALLSSLMVNYVDTREILAAYTADTPAERCAYATAEPDFFTHWAFSDPEYHCAAPSSASTAIERPPLTQWSIMLACYLQQFALIAMGFMVLFQLLAHVTFFRWPGLTGTGRRFGLRIRLDPDAPLRDFGLTRWNRALDRVYFYMSFGLLIPIVSRMGHQGPANTGHKILEVILLILWAAPILFSISTRQKWAYQAEERAMAAGRDAVIRFRENHIWPLDLHVLGKLWIGLSFSLYLVYLTRDWQALLDLFGFLSGTD